MHLLFKEQHGIDAQNAAQDLAHLPAPLLLMSFTDSDLLGLREAERRDHLDNDLRSAVDGDADALREDLQVVNLQRLRHPMSVDLYLDQTAAHAKVIIVRLLGGLGYWRYGVEEIIALSKKQGIALALLPGAYEAPGPLREASTVKPDIWDRLNGFFREGGARNWSAAFNLMRFVAGFVEDDGQMPGALPKFGLYRSAVAQRSAHSNIEPPVPVAWIIFYRAHLAAADLAGIDALMAALVSAGFDVRSMFVASLKQNGMQEYFIEEARLQKPDIVLNATFFSARRDGDDANGGGSVLDAIGVPVIQLLQPGITRSQWKDASRGLAQSDLAMQVALPELDGRLSGAVISFKEDVPPGTPSRREADKEGIRQAVRMALGWTCLAATPKYERRLALILSDYPGAAGQMAHAVGLDGFASLESILTILEGAGYHTHAAPGAEIAATLRVTDSRVILSPSAYAEAFARLPLSVQTAVVARWGPPDVTIDARYQRFGRVVVAVQPHRGMQDTHKATYHDLTDVPGHQYIGFYLWLRDVEALHALVHVGTHGTAEWLPGKAVALSNACLPAALCCGLPVIYPFIVNNPGEAAAAKRRLGAVTLGHLTPPMRKAGLSPRLAALERLIDEYAESDGMDLRRGTILRQEILRKAKDCGLWDECCLKEGGIQEEDALARLDAYLCDVKDLQIREGLHIYGRPAPEERLLIKAVAESCNASEHRVCDLLQACPEAEQRALLCALDGKFVPPGAAGAPTRGRLDVLPTGRNLTTLDPRHLPTPAAHTLAVKSCEDILTRHLQEEGRPLRQLVMDVWGSATFRTGGEDVALALALMGVRPTWATDSARVNGFEIIPLALLDRPRVDVTLRISGMFRDGFPGLIALFDQVVDALSSREEPQSWNSLIAEPSPKRIFGAAPQTYGTGVEASIAQLDVTDNETIASRYIAASSWAYSSENAVADPKAFCERLKESELLLHVQDHAETDILDSPEWAAHEGGLLAAALAQGGQPRFWHGDTSDGRKLRLRSLEDEVARITRGRLINPEWLASMQRHDYRGAAEIARSVAALCGFVVALPIRFDVQLDLVFAATLADETCDSFLRRVNPEAREDIRRRLSAMWHRGKWTPRQNSAAIILNP